MNSLLPNGGISLAPAPAPDQPAPVAVGGVQPKDAAAMQSLLASLGLQPGQYQPRVLAQLLEFQTRYAREILEDAQDYCLTRDRGGARPFIEPADLDLAIQTRLNTTCTAPPPRELLYAIAAARNAAPLPLVPTREGVHLPNERFCLLAPNYRVKTAPEGKKGRTEQKEHH